MPDQSNAVRWAELCGLYKQAREQGRDANFRMGRLAIHVKEAVARSCGCDDDYVKFYKIKHGHVPLYDQTEQVKNGWASVSETETGWVFALGVLLEIEKNTHPKTMIILPIEVAVRDKSFSVQSSLFSGVCEIRTEQEHYANEIAALGESIYEGLKQVLCETDEDRRAIGFHTLSE